MSVVSPGVPRGFLPALLRRSALAMARLALLLTVQFNTGSFTLRASASMCFGISIGPYRWIVDDDVLGDLQHLFAVRTGYCEQHDPTYSGTKSSDRHSRCRAERMSFQLEMK